MSQLPRGIYRPPVGLLMAISAAAIAVVLFGVPLGTVLLVGLFLLSPLMMAGSHGGGHSHERTNPTSATRKRLPDRMTPTRHSAIVVDGVATKEIPVERGLITGAAKVHQARRLAAPAMWLVIGASIATGAFLVWRGWGERAVGVAAGVLLLSCLVVCVWAGLAEQRATRRMAESARELARTSGRGRGIEEQQAIEPEASDAQ